MSGASPRSPATRLTVLVRLLDAIIDRLADELEGSGAEIEAISNRIFRREMDERRIPAARLTAMLTRIGRRAVPARQDPRDRGQHLAAAELPRRVGAGQRAKATRVGESISSILTTDVASLIDHSGFLADNLIFLLDAALGLISVEQNAAMKLFSWVALVFLPPTLIAGIYGMNFEHMPELKWLFGYPFALGLIFASAVLPLWYFKRRGWI